MSNLNPTEAQDQRTLFEWAERVRKQYPDLDLMYHVPNGGSRNSAEAKNLQRQGVKPGVPDICLPVPKGGYHGLYIELKRKSKYEKTEAQKEWLSRLGENGYHAVFAYGFDDAKKVIEWYLGLEVRPDA